MDSTFRHFASGVGASHRVHGNVRTWWKDLSVVKKLYAVFGVMAMLILVELLALSFAMNTLSALRALIEGEAIWSKAQKNAVQSLQQYAMTSDPQFYTDFQTHLSIPMGDHLARLELEKRDPDLEAMRRGFVQGGIHPADVDGVIYLLLRFHEVSYIKKATAVWAGGDDFMQELIKAGENLHKAIQEKRGTAAVREALLEIGRINSEVTALEIEFSKTLSEGSRWLERLLFFILLAAVLTVESTGLLLTYSFSRNLNQSLRELNDAAIDIGKGRFGKEVPVRSRDELGQLAMSLNRMSLDLQKNIGEREEAENANQTKTMFLANVSHELRTPLGVILGYVELMKDPDLPASDRSRYLEIVDRTGRNLNRIVNDILDISKVETGHIDLKTSRFNFTQFVQELAGMMDLKAKSRQTDLRFEPRGRIPEFVATDRDRLRQILVNLLNNALKFTDKGSVTVSYWFDGQRIFFEVLDTGIGIPESEKGRLFQQFSRIGSAQQTPESAGLGLALSRGLARIMGGDLTLKDSTPGTGSTFVVSVKVEHSYEVPVEKKSDLADVDLKVLKGRRILVVDDAPENQMIVRLFLTKQGMDVATADDGKAGVELAMKESFDLVLMDMQMPVMNGYEATRELRRLGFQKPIIAFTANAMKGDENRCLEAGCNAFISKPIEQKNLVGTLAKLLTTSPA